MHCRWPPLFDHTDKLPVEPFVTGIKMKFRDQHILNQVIKEPFKEAIKQFTEQ